MVGNIAPTERYCSFRIGVLHSLRATCVQLGFSACFFNMCFGLHDALAVRSCNVLPDAAIASYDFYMS